MHFIRLVRPLNLIIIGLTMYGLGWYFETLFENKMPLGIRSLHFLLLVISTILIAAAGNIINDYFDVKADRINKPDRLIIGKHVKRRVAIVSHWGLNFIAFSMAVFISWKLETFAYLFIHLMSINLLWFYSMSLKRSFLAGNLLIAALTAMVPIIVGLYFYQTGNLTSNNVFSGSCFPFGENLGIKYVLFLSTGLASFAFILNLAREIIKDMEDVEGDKRIQAKTLPIVLGLKKTKLIASSILSISLVGTSIVWLMFDSVTIQSIATIAFSAVLVIICLFFLGKSKTRSDYRRINNLIKLAMVAGLITPIFWNIYILYV